jgi:hypothetical protein
MTTKSNINMNLFGIVFKGERLGDFKDNQIIAVFEYLSFAREYNKFLTEKWGDYNKEYDFKFEVCGVHPSMTPGCIWQNNIDHIELLPSEIKEGWKNYNKRKLDEYNSIPHQF